MKKILLLAIAALMVTGANAQLKRSSAMHSKALPQAEFKVKPAAQMKEMTTINTGKNLVKAPKKAGYVECWYKRPAGGFSGFEFLEGGTYGGGYYSPFYMLKPYANYTFTGVGDGMEDGLYFGWDYQLFTYDEAEGWYQEWFMLDDAEELTLHYDWEYDEAPIIYALQDGEPLDDWQYGGYEMSGTDDNPIAGAFHPAEILAYPTFARAFGEEEGAVDLLVSSKSFCFGGREANQRYLMTYYMGLDPFGSNEYGWWFGKNAGRSNVGRIDGIAQAFEKPTHPYLLKQVVIETAVLEVAAPVEMTCRVYKLPNGLPAYDAEGPVALAEEPGELIAMGRAMLTPETSETTDGFIIFTLFGEEDGLEYEITPTIDDAIIVVVDGYNDPEMDNLTDFTAMISADDLVDEGYGELAYIKYGTYDDEGNIDYVWAGLNNFFSSGTMMTGLTIFITIDTPFLTYNWNTEDGEYTFPNEGGFMEKVVYDDGVNVVTTSSIEFFSWQPSVDEGWTLTCNGDDVPDWLSIELIDGDEDGEFNYEVIAEVTAEPLPAGVDYREAVVRFEYPGAYLDYTFKQGVKPVYDKFDVNRDLEVNIADVNYLIDMILSGNQSAVGDVNGDGEVNIADVNALIDRILTGA